jgi:hypothetical protein
LEIYAFTSQQKILAKSPVRFVVEIVLDLRSKNQREEFHPNLQCARGNTINILNSRLI